jgi:hypothetical protein
MISRVGRVAVTLRLADADRDRAEATRRTVEQVVIRHALDELERTIHQRYGASAIVRARRLSVRWRLDHTTLAAPETALELGRDLADTLAADLEATPKPQRLRPLPEASPVMFADEDHAIAAFLADRADDRTAWFHAPREDALAEWTAVVAAGPARVDAIVRWLERMERRAPVARMLERAAAVIAPATRRLIEAPDEPHAAPPVVAAPPPRTTPAIAVPGEARAAPAAAPAAPPPRTPIVVDSTPPAPEAPPPPHLEATDFVPTRAAGLWYLARLVLQLDLAEQLWAAGVLEGDFLAHVACAIGGPDLADDPCWRWFGGVLDREPRLDPLPSWACDELAAGRAASLARLVPHAPALDPLAGQLPCLAAGDAAARDVVARSAAALCTLFCARLGIAPDVERVRSHVRVPGRLELSDPLRVTIPMEHIDIDLRRAGLDQNPGFLPWVGRKVDLLFDEPLR